MAIIEITGDISGALNVAVLVALTLIEIAITSLYVRYVKLRSKYCLLRTGRVEVSRLDQGDLLDDTVKGLFAVKGFKHSAPTLLLAGLTACTIVLSDISVLLINVGSCSDGRKEVLREVTNVAGRALNTDDVAYLASWFEPARRLSLNLTLYQADFVSRRGNWAPTSSRVGLSTPSVNMLLRYSIPVLGNMCVTEDNRYLTDERINDIAWETFDPLAGEALEFKDWTYTWKWRTGVDGSFAKTISISLREQNVTKREMGYLSNREDLCVCGVGALSNSSCLGNGKTAACECSVIITDYFTADTQATYGNAGRAFSLDAVLQNESLDVTKWGSIQEKFPQLLVFAINANAMNIIWSGGRMDVRDVEVFPSCTSISPVLPIGLSVIFFAFVILLAETIRLHLMMKRSGLGEWSATYLMQRALNISGDDGVENSANLFEMRLIRENESSERIAISPIGVDGEYTPHDKSRRIR